MKKLFYSPSFVLVFSLLPSQVFAQAIDWDKFSSGISTSTGSSEVSGISSGGEIKKISSNDQVENASISQVSTCTITNQTQTSLPLSYLKRLSTGGEFFKVEVDEEANTAKIKSEIMIANCNQMLEISAKKSTTEPVVHYIMVGITGGKTVADFEACIAAEVIGEDGKIDQSKVQRGNLTAVYSFDKSGPIKFMSEGPRAIGRGHEDVEGCRVTEKLSKEYNQLLTLEDREKKQRDNYVNGLCKATDYRDISEELLEKYKEYRPILEAIRNELLLDDVKKLAKSIQAQDDLSNLDYSIIEDFSKYIVEPLMLEIKLTFEEMRAAQGDDKKELEKKLKSLKATLSSYKKSPYLTENDLTKLKNKGQFDAAEDLFALRAQIKEYEKINFIVEGNLLVTPKYADSKIKRSVSENRLAMQEERLKYQVKTGEVTGKSAQYTLLSKQLEKSIATNNQKYERNAGMLMQQAYRKCNSGWVNQQKCFEGYARTLQNYKVRVQKANERNLLMSQKYASKSVEFAALEQQGRAYRQSQEIEDDEEFSDLDDLDVTPDDVDISMPIDTTMPLVATRGGRGGQQSWFSSQVPNFQANYQASGAYDFYGGGNNMYRNPATSYFAQPQGVNTFNFMPNSGFNQNVPFNSSPLANAYFQSSMGTQPGGQFDFYSQR